MSLGWGFMCVDVGSAEKLQALTEKPSMYRRCTKRTFSRKASSTPHVCRQLKLYFLLTSLTPHSCTAY